MGKFNWSTALNGAKIFVSKHTPELLMAVGIAGSIATTVLAVKATPKALQNIDAAKKELQKDKLTAIETVKVAWKPYIPAAVTGVASVTCLVGSCSVSARRTATLAAAYQISETALAEYRDKVIDTVGEKKEQTIREKVAEEKIKQHPVSERTVYNTGKGNTLCYDPLSDRYFMSDIETIRRAENNLNKILLHGFGGEVALNEFYDEIGLNHTDLGKDVGWNAEYRVNLDITSHITEDDVPAAVIGHYNPPKYYYFQ